MNDTRESLQRELAGLKQRYLSGPKGSDAARDDRFANEEAAIGARFRLLGEFPSYPADINS